MISPMHDVNHLRHVDTYKLHVRESFDWLCEIYISEQMKTVAPSLDMCSVRAHTRTWSVVSNDPC